MSSQTQNLTCSFFSIVLDHRVPIEAGWNFTDIDPEPVSLNHRRFVFGWSQNQFARIFVKFEYGSRS